MSAPRPDFRVLDEEAMLDAQRALAGGEVRTPARARRRVIVRWLAAAAGGALVGLGAAAGMRSLTGAMPAPSSSPAPAVVATPGGVGERPAPAAPVGIAGHARRRHGPPRRVARLAVSRETTATRAAAEHVDASSPTAVAPTRVGSPGDGSVASTEFGFER